MSHQEENGTLHLSHCSFTNNAALNSGGAVYAVSLFGVLIDSSTFNNNDARSGGAVCGETCCLTQLRIHNCTFKRNKATAMGGALYFNTTSANISHSNLSENISPAAGAIYSTGKNSTLHLTKSKLAMTNHEGEQRQYGAAVWSRQTKLFVASTVVFCDNKAGGLILGATEGEIHKCSFDKNTGLAGAISAQNSKFLMITRSIFRQNRGIVTPALRLPKNTLIQNSTFLISGVFDNWALQLDTANDTVFRSSGNLFRVTLPQELDHMIMLASTTSSVASATLYFWDTWYQVNSSDLHPVDRDFVHKTSTLSHKNVSVEFSQFASG